MVAMMLGLLVWLAGRGERKLRKQARRDLREQAQATRAANEAREHHLSDDDLDFLEAEGTFVRRIIWCKSR